MIKAVYFDLFFTLINPEYLDASEYSILGITAHEWELYAEDEVLYKERATTRSLSAKEIIDKIIQIMPYDISDEQKRKIQYCREERMKKALLSVDTQILETIRELHKQGIMLGVISNADIIDIKFWEKSPLAQYFDAAIFSCNVGVLKPEAEIYSSAMLKLNALAEESLFVGDGGSDELHGAKKAGMKTVFTEYLVQKSENEREQILADTDYHINKFEKILDIISSIKGTL